MRMIPVTSARCGYMLAEAFVVLCLSALFIAVFSTAVITQNRLARAIDERVAHNDAVRMTMRVVPSELQLWDTRVDVRAVSADSIAGRWVRLSGVVCATQVNTVWLRTRGLRAPDASKDSVVFMTGEGERVFAPASWTRDQTRCAAATGESVYRAVLPALPYDATVALIFESGTYYLTQQALRYRLGGEGKQPITEELFRDNATSLQLDADRLTITLGLKPERGSLSARTEVMTIGLLNAAIQ